MRRALVLAVTLAAVPTSAHVAPSVEDNNRYLKLTPLGDRVRLAYTVFFGEVPGALLRRSLDANHDGAISDAEGEAFASRLAAEVAATLDVTVDDARRQVAWHAVSAGMGSPRTTAGSFSVDMIAYLCLPRARGRHALRLRDGYRLARPGETEIKIEDGPGIAIERARIGALSDPTHELKIVGPAGPLAEDGLELVFVASEAAAIAGEPACAGPASARPGLPAVLVIGAAAVLGGVLATLTVLLRRRRRSVRQ